MVGWLEYAAKELDWENQKMELLAVIRTAKLSAEGYAAALQLGVCVRCCLRFADVSDSSIYAYVNAF